MRLLRLLFALLSIAALALILLLPAMNRVQVRGIATFAGLSDAVEIVRDEKGMAYIYAQSLDDALAAQGYVVAQDRLFQMHMTRLLASGRLSEYLGESLLDTDKKMRTLGFYRIAERHAALLDQPTRNIFEQYARGVNQYLEAADERPLELKLLGATPEPWTITDSLAIMYYMGWNSAANIDGELLAHAILDAVGPDLYTSIAPLTINPDDQTLGQREFGAPWNQSLASASVQLRGLLNSQNSQPLRLGSNNWAISGERSASRKPIVANDPHLQTDLLPTTLYPLGLITPQVRVVGVNVSGLPGVIIGRNEHVAIGATNAYADVQDLYIEQIDPEDDSRYRDGDQFVTFSVIDSPIRVRDKAHESGYREEAFSIRSTVRGPVVSDVPDLIENGEQSVVSVRWAAVETMQAKLGLDYLLRARSVADVREILRDVTAVSLNLVFADIDGNLGWQTTGRVPIRRERGGGSPAVAPQAADDWVGWVDYEQMPSRYVHPRGWVGTANHTTVAASFPHYYSNWFSPRFRYERMSELLDSAALSGPQDSWQWMRDDRNGLAAELAPIMATIFTSHAELAAMGALLDEWDFHDRTDSAGAFIFQETMRRLVTQVFADELGEDLADKLNAKPYFWQERLLGMMIDGQSPWFDDSTTDDVETLADVILAAGMSARDYLTDKFGADPAVWRWGDQHRMVIVNPLRRSGPGSEFLGGGDHAVAGSGETLYRGYYQLDEDTHSRVVSSAALRMVVDLADSEKVMAVIPGGVSGRLFSPHYRDQVEPYVNGELRYWWFSDRQIEKNARARLQLVP
jgi:penicillin amidase